MASGSCSIVGVAVGAVVQRLDSEEIAENLGFQQRALLALNL
ncbi:MAG: hypothetical protein ACKO3W_10605 [bacterium]